MSKGSTASLNGRNEKEDDGTLSPLKYRPGPDAGCIERLMTPRFVLTIWTMMNFFTYFDRGAIAAALPSVSDDHSIDGGVHPLSNADGGALVSAFMVGFFVTCPIFAALGGTFTAKQIIVFGLVVWALACVSTAISQSYWMILISRMFVGVGEAAYAGYTVTIIDNMAPPKSRTLWIGTFYSMIPVGTALGMGVSGIVASNVNLGSFAGWRLVFLAEVVPMLPIIFFNCLLPNKFNSVAQKKQDAVHNDDHSDESASLVNADDGAEQGGDEFVTLPEAVKHLSTNLDWILLVFGYAMYTFVIGGISVWAISMLEETPLHLSGTDASVFLGGATAFSGLIGAVIGGQFVDKMGGSKGASGLLHCQKLNVAVMCVALPCGAFALTTNSFPLFAVLFVMGTLSSMTITAPITAAMLGVVPLPLRTYSVSFSIFFMHMLGDFPSPIIAGKISDAFDDGCSALSTLGNTTCLARHACWYKEAANKHESPACVNTYQLRWSMLIVWCVLGLCIPAWAVVMVRAYRRMKREEQEDAELTLGRGSSIDIN